MIPPRDAGSTVQPLAPTDGPITTEDETVNRGFFESVKFWSLICAVLVSFSAREVVDVLHEDFLYFHVRSVHRWV